MAYKNKLLPGQQVDLNVPDGKYAGRYKTRTDEVGTKLLSVVAPYIQGQIIPLQEGTKVEVIFWDEISAYTIETKIFQRIAVPVPMFVVELPDKVKKVQRRNYVRIPAFYPVTYRTVTREGLSDVKKGNMLDLSGGGMKFQTPEPVENKSLLYASFELPTGELQTPVRVCRVYKSDEEKENYIISAEFYEIPERDRDRIIRCVFELQRTMRKKGLI